MNNKSLATAQRFIIIAAIAYVIGPDLLIGPIDDAAVVALSGIAELVLGIIRAVSGNPQPSADVPSFTTIPDEDTF